MAQLLLQEFEQWDTSHPSFSSCWHPVHWEGTVTKPCKTPLFSLSLVTRILQGVSPAAGCPDIRSEHPLTDCTHCCGENNWERQPHSRDAVLGPPLACKKGSGERGGVPGKAMHMGIHFFQLLLNQEDDSKSSFAAALECSVLCPAHRQGSAWPDLIRYSWHHPWLLGWAPLS